MTQQSGSGEGGFFGDRNVRIATVIGLPVAVISLVVGLVTCSPSGEPQANPTAATPSPTIPPPAPTTDRPVSDSPSSAEPEPTSIDEPTETQPPPPTTKFIGQEDYLDYDAASSRGLWDFGSYDIASSTGTHTFGHSVLMNPGCQNGDGGDFWLDFKIDSGFTHLTGMVGPSITSPADSRFKFTLYADGVSLASGTVTSSTPARISVSVKDRSRLRFFMSDSKAPNRYCGLSKPYRLVWGDMQLSGTVQ